MTSNEKWLLHLASYPEPLLVDKDHCHGIQTAMRERTTFWWFENDNTLTAINFKTVAWARLIPPDEHRERRLRERAEWERKEKERGGR